MPEKAGLERTTKLTCLSVSTGTPTSSCQRSGEASAQTGCCVAGVKLLGVPVHQSYICHDGRRPEAESSTYDEADMPFWGPWVCQPARVSTLGRHLRRLA